jgi:SAM-dependent methyltransferase
MHELPPKAEVILVAAEPHLAEQTLRFLRARGRLARRAPFTYAEHLDQDGPGQVTQGMGRLWSPNPMVAEYAATHPFGRAIDLGCGTGRDAIYLGAAGWQVLAIDRLPEALARAAFSAESILEAAAARIEWRRADFGRAFDLGTATGRFDLAIVCRVLGQGALDVAAKALRKDGILLFETFSRSYWQRRGRERSVEMPGPEFDKLQRELGEDTLRIIARKV